MSKDQTKSILCLETKTMNIVCIFITYLQTLGTTVVINALKFELKTMRIYTSRDVRFFLRMISHSVESVLCNCSGSDVNTYQIDVGSPLVKENPLVCDATMDMFEPKRTIYVKTSNI